MNKIKTYSEFLNESQSGSKFFKKKEEVMLWLDFMGLENYTINDGLTVDVDGDVILYDKNLKYIPVKFGKVSGNFSCSNNKLTSLEFGPYSVGGYFSCYGNELSSLKGGPKQVGSKFNVSTNWLTSLEGCPEKIGGDFTCNSNKLTSLVFAPKEPIDYINNPSSYIYYELGFTKEAHIKCLLELDPDLKGTMEKLKVRFPERYKELIQNKRLRLELGLEDEELTNVYNKIKDIEGGYF